MVIDPPPIVGDIAYRYTLAAMFYTAGIALAWGLA